MSKNKEKIQNANEVLIKVENLSKKFCKDLKTSLWYGVKDLFGGTSNKNHLTLRNKEFWAVKGVSFELRRGECIGLIGHNGAGKSTLLKILNGLINPDDGKVTISGRVGALIELGAGFNPILTGRENIYNNGAVLGFTRKEIDAKLKDIIAFAELEEFMDMPVQHYSSGMKVRLGFAIAAQMEPDVLLIDEVLAVGDLGFVLKCFRTIDAILPKTAVIFVSHSMPMVSRVCNEVLLLNQGKVVYQGKDVAKGIDLYYASFSVNSSNILYTSNQIELENITLVNGLDSTQDNVLDWGQTLKLKLGFNLAAPGKLPLIEVTIYDKEQREVARLSYDKYMVDLPEGSFEVVLEHENLQLSKGLYSFSLTVNDFELGSPMLRMNNILSFQVRHEREVWSPFLLKSRLSLEKND